MKVRIALTGHIGVGVVGWDEPIAGKKLPK